MATSNSSASVTGSRWPKPVPDLPAAVATFANRPSGRDNGFNLIRVVAALAVIASHSVPLTLGEDHRMLLVADLVPGRVAVLIFFAISVYFISQSWDRRPSTGAYLAARMLRILPGLWVMLIFTLILGLWIRTEPLSTYLVQALNYVWHNMVLWPVRYQIGSLFADTPFGANVNRSLWTLRHEATCYLLVLVIGLFCRPGRSATTLVAMVLAAISVYGTEHFARWLFLWEFLNFAFPFFVGAALYQWRHKVPFSGWLALGLLGAMVLTRQTMLAELCMVLALAYGSLWLGFRGFRPMTAYNRFGDYSYGVYIYAFPVQQVAVTAGFDRPLSNALATVLVVLPLAILSWHLVEKPALGLKNRLADMFVRGV